jgi:hypothetical protein
MAKEKKKEGYKEFKNELDTEFDTARKYLQTIRDEKTLSVVQAHRDVDYDINNNPGGWADAISDALEQHIKDLYGISGDPQDERSFDGLMMKHLGVTRKHIQELAEAHGDKARDELEKQMNEADGQLAQTHYLMIADDYLKKPENLEHALKYFNLERHDSFKKDGFTAASARPLFFYHGIDGEIAEARLPKEMKSIEEKLKKKTKREEKKK